MPPKSRPLTQAAIERIITQRVNEVLTADRARRVNVSGAGGSGQDFGNAEERVECKNLKKELEEARSSNTLLRMQKERVERDLYWTRVQAHEFYQEIIHRGVVFEEKPNEAIDVLVEDEESPSPKRRGFLLCRDRIMPPKSRPLTQAAIERIITQRVNEVLTADRARRVNVSGAGGSGQGAVELQRWFKKTEMVFGISERVEGKKVKFAAVTLQGPALTWWNTKVATMG
nr:reverse transcriptase domain-containing protein [Tanacetum cinerariifolium]